MKGPIIFRVFTLFIFFSCSQKKNKAAENISPGSIPEEKVSITSIGGIQFTKSYSEIQSMTDEKKIDHYIEKVDKSNPYIWNLEVIHF